MGNKANKKCEHKPKTIVTAQKRSTKKKREKDGNDDEPKTPRFVK